MSCSGIAVALSSALCYDSKTVVLSLLGTYFGGIAVDHFIFGINIKRRVCVISKDLDKIVDFVLHELHSGATLNEIIGAYDKTPNKELITIVDKNEYKLLMDYIRKIAFSDIRQCTAEILYDTLHFLEGRKGSIDPTTQITYEFYKPYEKEQPWKH